VRGQATAPQVIATAMALAKQLKKVGVVAGNCPGFIGNRMFFDYSREAIALATEGASPIRIDAVMKAAGMAMGPFATFDLSGVDVFYHIQKERPDSLGAKSSVVDTMYERKRWGQKTGAGFHDYIKGNREPQRSEEIEALFAEDAKRLGIKPREISDQEIIDRLWLALANVGADLLEKGIAEKSAEMSREVNPKAAENKQRVNRGLYEKIMAEINRYAQERQLLTVRRTDFGNLQNGLVNFTGTVGLTARPETIAINTVLPPQQNTTIPASALEQLNTTLMLINAVSPQHESWDQEVLYVAGRDGAKEIDITDEIVKRMNAADEKPAGK